METYYRQEQEGALKDMIHYVRDTIQQEIWDNSVKLGEFAKINPDSQLWVRFLNRQFIDVPVGPLMLGEVLFLAQEKGWDIVGKAEKDERYLQSTEANHNLIVQNQREKSEEMRQMFESTLRPKDAQWKQEYNLRELSMFVPVFKLTRDVENAYISWFNEAYNVPSGKAMTSLWGSLVLDRTNNNESLEINQVRFYNPSLDLDIRQRIKIKKFWR